MKNYTPTFEELRRKTTRELHAIFREAAETAGDAKREPAERSAATKTMAMVKRCQVRPPAP